MSSLSRLGVVVLCLVQICLPARPQGVPIGFEELFALAPDRRAALAQLLPGTQDFYYYHCLQRQHEGDLAAVPALLATWIERHGRTERVDEIENRQALLSWPRDPDGSRNYLVQRLGLALAHERDPLGEIPNLPTRLDPRLIAWEQFYARALQGSPHSLTSVRDGALRVLAERELSDSLLQDLLQRLDRPDVPRLAELVARALRMRSSNGFGSLNIHKRMLLAQLEELATAMPELLGHNTFVYTWLERLVPSDDDQWQRDPVARQAYLERLEAFAQRLSPAFNSLKARILYHRLAHDLALGRPDLERFRAYLRLPRQAYWAHPRIREEMKAGQQLAELGSKDVRVLEPVADDEPLVRAYLEHFLREAETPESFAQLLEKAYLEGVFAETKLLHGVGDQERWYALLNSPARVEALEKRVELLFAPTLGREFAADAPVAVELDVKNVPTLIVKVYEIDALSFYKSEGREVDASITLDGLVANEERTLAYTEPPLRRMRRRFEFPALTRPGVYVLEFIGNGSASRAVVRKGGLQVLTRSGAAGMVLTVLDETGARRPDAAVHMGARRYAADESGEVVLPFSTDNDPKVLALEAGGRAALVKLVLPQESYKLHAGFLLDREALRAGRTASVVVRTALTANGEPASARLLEEPALAIETIDLLGIKSSAVVRGLELRNEQEFVHAFQVPEGLADITFTLRGRVKRLGGGEPVELKSAGETISLNLIDATERTWSPLLSRSAAGYFLELLGKNGEPKADQPVQLQLRHRDFNATLEVVLKSDAAGRIELGALEGILHVAPLELPGIEGWLLPVPDAWPVRQIHGRVGETLRVPYSGAATSASRAVLSLLEERQGAFVRDAFEHLSIAGGYVELRNLAAGDYSLWMGESRSQVHVLITEGEAHADLLVGRDRVLERSPTLPLHVSELAVAGDALNLRISGAGESTRVHVFATRYLPARDPLRMLLVDPPASFAALDLEQPLSEFHAGREIGDELRYVLDRRHLRRFPGNMLRRPGLILNPWSLEETSSMTGHGGAVGRRFGGRSGGRSSGGKGPGDSIPEELSANAQLYANLDFLAGTTTLLANLRPGLDGTVRIPLADLGNGRIVHVLVANAETVVRRTLALPEAPLATAGRRLEKALDPARHFAELRSIEFVPAGARATLTDSASTFRTYSTLAEVYGAFRALAPGVDIETFEFLVRWPRLSPEEKRALYSEHACHELHFFLHKKDPQFFDAVVRPYLANKVSKTFLDQWLLEQPLEGFLESWRFERLNILERILLVQRLGRGEALSRRIDQELELDPPDPEVEEEQFSTLLLGRALEVDRSKTFPGPSSPGPATPGGPQANPEERAGLEAEKKAERLREAELPPAEAMQDLKDKAGRDDLYLGRGESDMNKDFRRSFDDEQPLFRPLEPTRVYAEHDWWHRPVEEHDQELIGANRFWHDYATRPANAPFVSTRFAEATGSVAEMLCALAVLDLPFEAEPLESERAGAGVALRAKTPLLLVRKELREAKPAAGATALLVSQDFFRLDDPYRYEGSKRFDKLLRDGFVVGVAYGCRVVVTNPTSAPEAVELLLQVPEGALPVNANVRTRGLRVELEAYETFAHEYAFYFPLPGRFAHHPVQVTREGALLASAQPVVLEVLAKPAALDDTSWQHISQRGSLDQVIAYLEGANLERLSLGRLAWRLRDRPAFERILAHLRERFWFDAELWAYGFLHGDERAMREYLHHRDDFITRCGRWLRSPLLDIDPIEQRTWQHLQFEPLVNARAHRFGPRRMLLDQDVGVHYLELLEILALQPSLGDREWMSVSFHLLLQDRVEEGLEAFARVNPAALDSRLQHEYMSAYVAFYQEDLAAARRIAQAHREHPVARWRALFQDVLNQLDEAEGAAAAISDAGDQAQRQGRAAATEATLALAVEGRALRLSARNLASVELRYHPMDIEFLFSTSPFVQQESSAAVYVRPHRVDVVAMPASGELAVELPAEYRNANVLVEARGEGLMRRQPSVASSLDVHWMEGFGQLAVHARDGARPLSKVYVKVFARLPDGSVRFHKDGYTDIRGRFDYASVSGEGAEEVARFAILVLSDTDGALVAEVAPPER